MTDVAAVATPPVSLGPEVTARLDVLGHCDIALGVLTYNNAETLGPLLQAALTGIEKHFAGQRAVLVNADADSADDTRAVVAAAGLAAVTIPHDAPAGERVSVPFHGVPGRRAAMRQTLAAAQRLGARVLVLLEADLVSMEPEWMRLLVEPVLEAGADLVSPVYARHRYDSTITNLVLAPLVRALFARRVQRPLAGQQAFSAPLVEHLLGHPGWETVGRDTSDLWMLGTAIADGFALWEAWLGRRVVRSRTRTTDLPAMVAQTLGSTFTLMDHHPGLWTETHGSEPLPAVGRAVPPSVTPVEVDVGRMIEAFTLGLRDLTGIWEQILAPETMGEVLGLEASAGARLRFPDELWARIVYDFGLAHHYNVVHREHLLRSLVPLYLGRTAAFVLATREGSAEASESATEAVGAAFENQKPYLVERWR